MNNRRVAFLSRDMGHLEFVDPSVVAQKAMRGLTGIVQKRDALLQSEKLQFWAQAGALIDLYKTDGPNMTLGELREERSAILRSDLNDYDKLGVLEQLYKSAGACITGDGLKAERENVMALDWLACKKIPLLNALYDAILPRLTGDVVLRECKAIFDSSIASKQQARIAKKLFDSCTHFTMSDIKEAHKVVKNARLESEEKQVLVQLVCDFILQTFRLETLRLEGVAAKRELILGLGLPTDNVTTLLVALYKEYFGSLSLDDIFSEYNAIIQQSRCFNADDVLQQLFKGTYEPLFIEDVAVLREDLLLRRYSVSLTVLYERLDEPLSADDIAVERQALLASGFYEDSIAALLVSLYKSQRGKMTFELMQTEKDAIFALDLKSHNKAELLQQLFEGVKELLSEEQVGILRASICGHQLEKRDQVSLVRGLYQALSGKMTVAFVQQERAVILSSKLQAKLLGGLYDNSIVGLELEGALGEREALYACDEISENRVLFLTTLYEAMKQRSDVLADTLGVIYERVGDRFTPEVFRTERDVIRLVNKDEANWKATYMALLQHGCECLKSEDVSLERAFLVSVTFGRWPDKPLSNVELSGCLTVLYTKSAQSLALDAVHDELDALMSSRLGDLDIFRLARLMFSSVHSKMPVEWIHSERAWLLAQVKNVNALDAADAEKEDQYDDWEYTRDYPSIGLFDPWFIAHRIVNLYQASGTLLGVEGLQEERRVALASDMDLRGRTIILRGLYSNGSVPLTACQIQEERAVVLSPEFYGDINGKLASSYAAPGRLELLKVLYGTHAHCLTGDVFQEERDALLQADLPDEARAIALKLLYKCVGTDQLQRCFVSERRAILESDISDAQKSGALRALYECCAEHFSAAHLGVERDSILKSGLDRNSQIAAFGALYEHAGQVLQPAEVARERAALLQYDSQDEQKESALSALYKLCGSQMTEGDVKAERAAVLSSDLSVRRQAIVLRALYGFAGGNLSPGAVIQEREVVLGTDWAQRDQVVIGMALKELYQAGKAQLAIESVQSERAAILSSMLEGSQKVRVVSALYAATQEMPESDVQTERTEIIDSEGLSSWHQAQLVVALYGKGASRLSKECVMAEHKALMLAFSDSDDRRIALLGLYEAAVTLRTLRKHQKALSNGELTKIEAVETERAAILSSRMKGEHKVSALRRLYNAAVPELTFALMQKERNAILATSRLNKREKRDAIQELYLAVSPYLTREEGAAELKVVYPQVEDEEGAHTATNVFAGVVNGWYGRERLSNALRKSSYPKNVYSKDREPNLEARLQRYFEVKSVREIQDVGLAQVAFETSFQKLCRKLAASVTSIKELDVMRTVFVDSAPIMKSLQVDVMQIMVGSLASRLSSYKGMVKLRDYVINRMGAPKSLRLLATVYSNVKFPLPPVRVRSERGAIMESPLGAVPVRPIKPWLWKLQDKPERFQPVEWETSDYRAPVILSLYKNAFKQMQPVGVVQMERAEVLSSTLSSHDKRNLLICLYGCVNPAELLMHCKEERAAILDSELDANERAGLLQELYDCVKEELTVPAVQVERQALLESNLAKAEIVPLLSLLYRQISQNLTVVDMQTERAAILDSELGTDEKARILRELYNYVMEKLIAPDVQAERKALLVCDLANTEIVPLLSLLYKQIRQNLTVADMQTERAALLKSQLPDYSTHGLIKRLYRVCGNRFTTRDFFIERQALMASTTQSMTESFLRSLYEAMPTEFRLRGVLPQIYQVEAARYSAERVAMERKIVVGLVGLDDHIKSTIIRALYGLVGQHQSPAVLHKECIALLAFIRSDAVDQVRSPLELQLFQQLFTIILPTIDAVAVRQNRAAILESSVHDMLKEDFVKRLYRAAGSRLDADAMQLEREVLLLPSTKINGVACLRVLYSSIDTAKLTEAQIRAEQEAVKDGLKHKQFEQNNILAILEEMLTRVMAQHAAVVPLPVPSAPPAEEFPEEDAVEYKALQAQRPEPSAPPAPIGWMPGTPTTLVPTSPLGWPYTPPPSDVPTSPSSSGDWRRPPSTEGNPPPYQEREPVAPNLAQGPRIAWADAEAPTQDGEAAPGFANALQGFTPTGKRDAKYRSVTSKAVALVAESSANPASLVTILAEYKAKLVWVVAQRNRGWHIFKKHFPERQFSGGVVQIFNAFPALQDPTARQTAFDALENELFNNNRKLRTQIRRALGIPTT